MFICRLDILTALLKLNIHIKSGFHASSFRLCSWMAPFSEAVVGEDCVLHILVLVVEGWQAVLLEGEVAPSEFLSWGFAGRLLVNICVWMVFCMFRWKMAVLYVALSIVTETWRALWSNYVGNSKWARRARSIEKRLGRGLGNAVWQN